MRVVYVGLVVLVVGAVGMLMAAVTLGLQQMGFGEDLAAGTSLVALIVIAALPLYVNKPSFEQRMQEIREREQQSDW